MSKQRMGGSIKRWKKVMGLLGVFLLYMVFSPSLVEAVKWEKIPRELLLLQGNPYDKGAGALIVFNNGEMQVFYRDDIWWELSVYKRIKIFGDDGKDYATVTIPYGEQEKITQIEARTILPNGQKIKLNKNQIFDVPRISGLGRYVALAYGKAKKFTIPGVQRGAIIEYQYKRESKRIHFLDPWFFQGEDYTLSSSFAVTLPKEFQYTVHFVNAKEANTEPNRQRWIDDRGMTFTWTMKDIPGVKEEPFMPPKENLLSSLQFVLTYFNSPSMGPIRILSDWERVAEIFGGVYRSRLGRRGRIPKLIQRLTLEISNPEEKIARIYDYIQRHIKYVPLTKVWPTGNYAGSILQGKQAENVDMNVLLIAMLDEAGIKAYPAMLAPRDGPRLNQGYPSPVQFDRLITWVPLSRGKALWLDPVVRGTPCGILPWQDQGVSAFVLKDKGTFITTPETAYLNRETRTLKLTVGAGGQISGEGSISTTGESAIVYRRRYAYKAPKDQRKTFLKQIQKQVTGARLNRFAYYDQLNGTNPVQLEFTFQGTDYATVTGKRLFVNPALLARVERNILPAGKRLNPIQLGPVQRTIDEVTLVVPEGYQVEQLPAAVSAQSPFGRFLAGYQETPEGIVYTRSYSITKPNLGAEYYDDLRTFFERISFADQQQIVFQASGR